MAEAFIGLRVAIELLDGDKVFGKVTAVDTDTQTLTLSDVEHKSITGAVAKRKKPLKVEGTKIANLDIIEDSTPAPPAPAPSHPQQQQQQQQPPSAAVKAAPKKTASSNSIAAPVPVLVSATPINVDPAVLGAGKAMPSAVPTFPAFDSPFDHLKRDDGDAAVINHFASPPMPPAPAPLVSAVATAAATATATASTTNVVSTPASKVSSIVSPSALTSGKKQRVRKPPVTIASPAISHADLVARYQTPPAATAESDSDAFLSHGSKYANNGSSSSRRNNRPQYGGSGRHQTMTPVSVRSNRRMDKQTAWADEDISGYHSSEFDFQGNLDRFDKQKVYAEIREQDDTDPANLLVTLNLRANHQMNNGGNADSKDTPCVEFSQDEGADPMTPIRVSSKPLSTVASSKSNIIKQQLQQMQQQMQQPTEQNSGAMRKLLPHENVLDTAQPSYFASVAAAGATAAATNTAVASTIPPPVIASSIPPSYSTKISGSRSQSRHRVRVREATPSFFSDSSDNEAVSRRGSTEGLSSSAARSISRARSRTRHQTLDSPLNTMRHSAKSSRSRSVHRSVSHLANSALTSPTAALSSAVDRFRVSIPYGPVCPAVTPAQWQLIERHVSQSTACLAEDQVVENAGRSAALFIMRVLGGSRRISIENHNSPPLIIMLCGNNRTGAYALAASRHLANRRCEVIAFVAGSNASIVENGVSVASAANGVHGSNAFVDSPRIISSQIRLAAASGVRIEHDIGNLPSLDRTNDNYFAIDLVVDALVGAHGTYGTPDDAASAQEYSAIRSACAWVTSESTTVLSFDLPTGYHAHLDDTVPQSVSSTTVVVDGLAGGGGDGSLKRGSGSGGGGVHQRKASYVAFPTIVPRWTLCFGAPSTRLASRAMSGELHLADIGIPSAVWRAAGLGNNSDSIWTTPDFLLPLEYI
ncbi:hypothetical protein GQ42DRAFT_34644 [Ramicandelaber brevisporus]|nr:hypothetical protein GQ42DRAFT_34644 [Ramicandelaber brevisporus]